MSKKIKLQEFARDMGLASKEVISLLGEYSDTPKKNTSALETDELNFLVEKLTQTHQDANFDRYFSAKEYPLIDRADPERPRKKPA